MLRVTRMRPLADVMSGVVIIATEVVATQAWQVDRAIAMRHRLEVLSGELGRSQPFATMLAMAADHALDFATGGDPLQPASRKRAERWRSLVGVLLPMVMADRDYENDVEITRRAFAAREWSEGGGLDDAGAQV